MRPEFSSILFDLDGTIVDSAPGITATLAYTFEQLGLPVPPHEELIAYVGPPLLDSFRDLAGFTIDAVTARARGVSPGVPARWRVQRDRVPRSGRRLEGHQQQRCTPVAGDLEARDAREADP